MDSAELNEQLVAVGKKIKAKGWQTVGIDIYVQYLAALDRPQGPLDPMISYRPSIRATPHRPDGSFYGSGGSQEYVREDVWEIKTLDRAVDVLHAAADKMPTMAAEATRIDEARSKLSDDDRRLLGVAR